MDGEPISPFCDGRDKRPVRAGRTLEEGRWTENRLSRAEDSAGCHCQVPRGTPDTRANKLGPPPGWWVLRGQAQAKRHRSTYNKL